MDRFGADLLDALDSFPKPARYRVAYSGGLDSHVLLHALAGLRGRLRAPLCAVHVHHGLQAEADQWERHCAAVCAGLEVSLDLCRVGVQPQAGESLEAQARDARYRAIAGLSGAQEMLLTAQHQDDQAETLLLQLLRGAGVEGLAGMPACKVWHDGWHARPLLTFPRDRLRDYAARYRLEWVDDPSNDDSRFDRNYLRHQVMPVLRQRWPAAGRTMARSAAHLAATLDTLAGQAADDLRRCTEHGGADSDTLLIEPLNQLPAARRQAVLRAWVRGLGQALPDQARLGQVEQHLLGTGGGGNPLVSWSGIAVRRYRARLWLTRAELPQVPTGRLAWPDGQTVLELPNGLGQLVRRSAVEGIPDRLWQAGEISVGWRDDDTCCRPAGRRGTRSFKKLCQGFGIPHWRRDRLPLLFARERLLAVADYCLCGEPVAARGEACSQVHWERPAFF